MEIIRIGRENGDVIINNDDKVSRKHCEIIKDDRGNFKLVDYSKNGTLVNGVLRKGEVKLKPTDIIQVGRTNLPWLNYFSNNTGYFRGGNNLSKRPKTYLGWSIVSAFFSLVFGIVAIVYSARVDKLWDRGDYEGAESASSKAKMWLTVAYILGGIQLLIALIVR